ncbi:MAG: DNA polymerase III subunit gamma/tau [Solobacterium sp.]|nr:DNA polymerase III subunit gamma/tau [Solobacterium sp.]
MSNTALYQKYRSQSFDELVGQEYVVRAVRNAVKENKVGHAYLFCGPRGTGKTSMARLLARAVNCEHPDRAPCNECANCKAAMEGTHPDIIEINAANETHVEDIRDLIDRARLSPMMGQNKIYIVDEVHQLSSSAASALLKTLEEPPEHVIFILATTDPQKLLKTIISRCQRFDFSKVEIDKIQAHLLNIAVQEGFLLESEAARKIAELADGGMRDSLSILEQARAYGNGEITEEVIDSIFGLASTEEQLNLLKGIMEGNLSAVLAQIRNCEEHGTDLRRLTEDLITALKDGIIYQYTRETGSLHVLREEQAMMLQSVPVSRMLAMIDVFMKAEDRYRTAVSVTSVFEIACLELMNLSTTKVQESIPAPPLAAPAAVPVKEPEHSVPISAPSTPEPPKTATVSEPETKELSNEDVLELLVQCDKVEKANAEQVLNRLLSTPGMNRFNALLRQMKLCAAGKDVLLLSGSAAAAHMAEEAEFKEKFYEYLKEGGLDRVPFAVTTSRYGEAVEEFRNRARANTLPAPRKIVRFQDLEPSKEDQLKQQEDAVFELFGKDNVEVIDEGE